jgi:hypothetical protein
MSDKTHVEHNESGITLIADIPGDMDFHCNGPTSAPVLFDHFVRAGEDRLRHGEP